MEHRNAIPVDVQGLPVIQWANSKTSKINEATGVPETLTGFHSEYGRDDVFDAACEALGVQKIFVLHRGKSETTPHWFLGANIQVFPLTAGPTATSFSGLLKAREATAAAGIGAAWPNGEKSRMAVRGYIAFTGGDGKRVLITDDTGAPMLLQVGVRSLMCEEFLAALVAHMYACQAADGLRKDGKQTPLYQVALPLGPGKMREFGRTEKSPVVPVASKHPAEFSADYLRGMFADPAWRLSDAARSDWPSTTEWAQSFARSGDGIDAQSPGGTDGHYDASAVVAVAHGVRNTPRPVDPSEYPPEDDDAPHATAPQGDDVWDAMPSASEGKKVDFGNLGTAAWHRRGRS